MAARSRDARLVPLLRAVARRFLPLQVERWLSNMPGGASGLLRDDLSPPLAHGLCDARYPDIFVFSAPDRPQGVDGWFLGVPIPVGRRIFCFSFADVTSTGRSVSSPAPSASSLLAVRVPRPGATSEHLAWEQALGNVHELMRDRAVDEAVCLVQDPVWEPLVRILRERYGWKVINQSMPSEPAHEDTLADKAARARLLACSDLVYQGKQGVGNGGPGRTFWEEVDALYGKASIIIVSYDGLEFTRQCVGSVLQHTVYPDYEVIIVDNNSRPAVRAYLAELQAVESRVRVVFNDSNRGFAAANNTGLQRAGESEFVVLLNNDTVVPRGWLCRLLRHAREPDVGMVGPITNWAGNEARREVRYRGISAMERFARASACAHEGEVFDIPMLGMHCVTMRRAIVDQIGPLDERFGLGMFEDEDYARRVRKAGYRVVCAQDVFVHHYGMGSFARLGKSRYHELFERNRRLYEEKWGEVWQPHKLRRA